MKLPQNTTKHKIEPKPEKGSILFAPELIPFIKEKKKYKTYRYGKKYDYVEIGDEIDIVDNEKRLVGKAVVVDKEYSSFKDLPLKTPGHEPFKSKEHQREVFSGYYAYIGQKIKDDDQFILFTYLLSDL